MPRYPDHPILERPWLWSISKLTIVVDSEEGVESYLDLTLTNGRLRRCLRFFHPCNINVGKNFPDNNSGMCILDITSKHLDGLTIEVANFENADPSIEFLAHSVKLVEEN